MSEASSCKHRSFKMLVSIRRLSFVVSSSILWVLQGYYLLFLVPYCEYQTKFASLWVIEGYYLLFLIRQSCTYRRRHWFFVVCWIEMQLKLFYWYLFKLWLSSVFIQAFLEFSRPMFSRPPGHSARAQRLLLCVCVYACVCVWCVCDVCACVCAYVSACVRPVTRLDASVSLTA